MTLLKDVGVEISKRQVIRFLTQGLDAFHADDAAVLHAGLVSTPLSQAASARQPAPPDEDLPKARPVFLALSAIGWALAMAIILFRHSLPWLRHALEGVWPCSQHHAAPSPG